MNQILSTASPKAAAPQSIAAVRAALVFASSLAASFDRWFTRRAKILAMRQLHALDDRMLKDIGLHRSQIESAVLTGKPNGDRKERFWSA